MGHLVKSKLAPVVEKVDDTIHCKNLCPLATAIGNGSLILIRCIGIYLVLPDSIFHRINHYSMNKHQGNQLRYPLASDIFRDGWAQFQLGGFVFFLGGGGGGSGGIPSQQVLKCRRLGNGIFNILNDIFLKREGVE